MVTDHKILRDFVDFKVGPWILDWTKPLWGLLSKWNDLVNTLGDNEVAVILSFFIILLGCIYSIGNKRNNPLSFQKQSPKPHQEGSVPQCRFDCKQSIPQGK